MEKMVVSDVALDIHKHGKALDDMKRKVQCNYCEKIVSGFYRLKCHIGGIRGDVLPCRQVPSNIKEAWETKLRENKKGYLSKEVDQLCRPNLPRKRNLSPSSGFSKNDNEIEIDIAKHQPSGNKRVKKAVDPMENSSSLRVKKSIARFFYETGINFNAAESPSFKKMVNEIRRSGGCEPSTLIPSYQHLRGTILKDEVKEIQEYVKEVRGSWVNTGCSILLDGWTDRDGRNLMNIIVDCPKGAIYLKSLDISAALQNDDMFQLILDEVIIEIGVENVVQLMTFSSCMEKVGQKLMEKYKTIFWTVSGTHCLELILERFSALDLVKGIMEKAKTITKFIYNCATLLKIMGYYTGSCELVKASKIRSAMPYLTLENILEEKENLKEMFSSSEWKSSIWASSVEGKKVADLVVTDHSFWSGTAIVVKATIPIVTAMSLIHKSDKPLLGYIYETLDQTKEMIREELNKKRAHYMPFWEIIDDVWDNKLHNPLHSAGYFLNPSLFYSDDFLADAEVSSGLLCYIVRAIQDKDTQALATMQVQFYGEARGSFSKGHAPGRRSNISPDEWWSKYGRDFPELQKLAIRLLSQTCDGATKYQLRRGLAEELLTNKGKRNLIEQQRLKDLTILHYNLQLKNFLPGQSTIKAEEIDPSSNWIVNHDQATNAAAAAAAANDDIFVRVSESSSWMEAIASRDEVGTSTGENEGSSSVLRKQEPADN